MTKKVKAKEFVPRRSINTVKHWHIAPGIHDGEIQISITIDGNQAAKNLIANMDMFLKGIEIMKKEGL